MTTLIIILISLILLVALTIGIGHVAFSVQPRPSRESPDALELVYEDIYFRNDNDEVLHGWWVPYAGASQTTPVPTLVLLHGWGRNCQRMLPYLKILGDLPVNFLVIEGRGHCENRRNRFISQVGLTHDLLRAIDWLTIRPEVDVERIGIIGHSFGAAAAIYGASLDIRITAFIADASYAHPREIIANHLKSYHIPFFPLGWFMQQYIQIRLQTTFERIAPVNAITKVKSPGLIVHGTDDTTVPYENSQRIMAAADSENIQHLRLEGVDHSNTTDHPEFAPRIRNFISEHLLSTSASRQQLSIAESSPTS